jgi:hypothetical protein
MITYHDIEVKVTDFCISDLNNEVLVKIETEEGNRWSNGWVAGLDLVFTGDDSLKTTCDRILEERSKGRAARKGVEDAPNGSFLFCFGGSLNRSPHLVSYHHGEK